MNRSCGSASSEHYEALRRNALECGRIFSGDPLGAILVVKAGVAGWIRQWRQVSGEIIATPSTPLPRSCPQYEPGWQHELTVLLAQMSARHLRPSLSA
jgi:hypothetical protein